MSSVKPGDSVVLLFTTEDQNRSAVVPTALPTAQLIENGVADTGVAVIITPIGAGVHQASFTVPGTYNQGDQVQLEVNYTAGSVLLADRKPPAPIFRQRSTPILHPNRLD